MQLVGRKSGHEVWVYRWSQPDQKGKPKRIEKVVGPLAKFSTEDAAWAEVERLGLGRSFDEFDPRNFKELVDHLSKTELSEEQSEDDWRASSTKEVYRLYLKNWIVPGWGSSPLDQVKSSGAVEGGYARRSNALLVARRKFVM